MHVCEVYLLILRTWVIVQIIAAAVYTCHGCLQSKACCSRRLRLCKQEERKRITMHLFTEIRRKFWISNIFLRKTKVTSCFSYTNELKNFSCFSNYIYLDYFIFYIYTWPSSLSLSFSSFFILAYFKSVKVTRFAKKRGNHIIFHGQCEGFRMRETFVE